ncbi:MAG: PAS domain-containing protein, partial [Acidobacteriota bacterium]|nr:PAS domain-containing protein [Acidobacteriota bacterium]
MNISNNNAEQYYDERLNKAETNEKKLSTIINSLPDLVMQIDKDLKITWANKATLRLNPDAIGQICYKALPGRYSICPNCPIVKALKTGQTEYGVVHQKFIPKIGESFWDDIGVPIKDSTGKTTSVVKVARNITEKIQGEVEKKKLESQLRQAMKMESVGRLAGGVAHDFNNMLGVIIGYTDIILDQMDQNHPFHSGLVKIRNAGERSSDLTQQLLAFARKQ